MLTPALMTMAAAQHRAETPPLEPAGVGPDQAREYIRAVLATVREATREEFFDVTVQLPAGYGDLIAVGPAHR
ncbi:MAG: hypothetical protein ABW022_23760 [Actinoplanes sp.]